MRRIASTLVLACILAALPLPAGAAEKPEFGPMPAWVHPAAAPAAADLQGTAPFQVLSADQQVWFHGDTTSIFQSNQVKLLRPEALAALGTVALQWKPDTDRLTVHAIRIHRADKTIDVLGDGHALTILRRENNLEMAQINGLLTATMQVEGIQVGDSIELAYTLDRTEPLLKGHHDLRLDAGTSGNIGALAIAAKWDDNLPITVSSQDLSAPLIRGRNAVSLSANAMTPLVMPAGAPDRYRRGRSIAFSDFRNWGEVAGVFTPLFDKARQVQPASPLLAEIATIKAASPDPLVRAGMALALVENAIRYLYLGLNDSNLRPATADETWQRRFGDCKGKSALLLALLDGLGVTAEPALASIRQGDGLDQGLPNASQFDHVIVRATIGGKVYWLDGTRLGDRSLAALKIPGFHWTLPLHPGSARLEALVVPPADAPAVTYDLHLDASKGVVIPALAHAEATYRDDSAQMVHMQLAALQPAQREQALQAFWRDHYDFITAGKVSENWDEASRTNRLVMDGTAKMDWNPGQSPNYYEVDGAGVGWKPDYHRDPGTNSDAPFAINYPDYTEYRETVVLPGSGSAFHLRGEDVDRVLAQRALFRKTVQTGNTVTMVARARPLAPELALADARAAEEPLRELAKGAVNIVLDPRHYVESRAELEFVLADPENGTEQSFLGRGRALVALGRYAEALALAKRYTTAFPQSAAALADRAFANSLAGNDAAAQQDAAAALAIAPDTPKAKLVVEYSRWRAGISASREADMIPNVLASAYIAEANRCFNESDFECALQKADLVLSIHPLLTDLYVMRANALKRSGHTDQAIAEADRMIKAAPKNADMLAVAGVIYGSQGKTDLSLRAFAASLAAKPTITAYINRARFLPATDQVGRKRDIDAALALDSHDRSALFALADWQTANHDYKGSVATLETAAAGIPGMPYSNFDMGLNLAKAYAMAGLADKARAQFAALRGFASGTRNPQQFNNLCYAAATANFELEAALADCQQAVALVSEAHVFDSLGFVQLRLGHLDEAMTAFDKALSINPNLAPTLYSRGIVKMRRGAKAAAEADIAAAAKLQPDIADQFRDMGVAP